MVVSLVVSSSAVDCLRWLVSDVCRVSYWSLLTEPRISLTVNSGVTMVGDTRGGNWGCHPSIFSWKNWRPFLVASSAVSPLISSSQKLTTFSCSSLYRFLLLSLGCHPLRGCHPTPFLPVRPRFSTILCKFAHKKFSFGCHPPGRCHPERSAPQWRHWQL